MKTSNQLLLLSMLAALPVTAVAADGGTGQPDTSKWECKACPVDQGWSGSVDVGLGHVSEKSYKFGEYTGLNKQGGFFVGEAEELPRAAHSPAGGLEAPPPPISHPVDLIFLLHDASDVGGRDG